MSHVIVGCTSFQNITGYYRPTYIWSNYIFYNDAKGNSMEKELSFQLEHLYTHVQKETSMNYSHIVPKLIQNESYA